MSRISGSPQLLHVGERKTTDKNYETSEVVLAPPGTVVAPIPKGVKVTDENAIALILQQLMQMAQSSKGGTQPQSRVKKAASGVTVPNDPYQLLNYGLQYGLGSAQLGQQATQNTFNNNLATKQQGINVDQQMRTNALNNLARVNAIHQTMIGNAQTAATNQQQLEMQRLNMQSGSNDNSAELALRRLLGMRELDISQQVADQNYALGGRGLDLRGQELAQQLQLVTKQLGLQQASDEFARIMAGVSEASLPGVRAGSVPSMGVFG